MDSLGNEVKLDSRDIESEILKSVVDKKTLTIFTYPFTATSMVIPAIKEPGCSSCPERNLTFSDTKNETKALLYRLVVAAYNYVFFDEFAAKTAKSNFSAVASPFVDWLNCTNISNPYSVLKDYEAHCFDSRDNHGGASVLPQIKSLFFYAIDNNEAFRNALTQYEFELLIALRKTKVSPNLNKQQISLSSYFGALDWLRYDDVGIGVQLYQTLASPKLLVNSLKLTTSTILIEFYKAKSALKQFFKTCALPTNSLDLQSFSIKTNYEKKIFVGQCVYSLLAHYHALPEKNRHLKNALELVLISNTSNQVNFEEVLLALESKEKMDTLFLGRKRNVGEYLNFFADKIFTTNAEGTLFSVAFLRQLMTSEVMPISQMEAWMFSWLMASQAVQPSDVPKLKKQSFRMLKVGERVTHIECEYFKGRANAIHRTRSLSTRTVEGRAVLLYLNQHPSDALTSFGSDTPSIMTGLQSVTGQLNALLGRPIMLERLQSVHIQVGRIPCVAPAALCALISYGKNIQNIGSARKTSRAERKVLLSQCKTPCQKHIFGLLAIKNSAVHAYSDPYTLHYLINRNSHTNKTEKTHYLNADNEEWMNAAGRITRSVMLDLINNVFDLGFVEEEQAIEVFNNEFANVTDAISYKSSEMLSRFQLVTEQEKGAINEIGVLSRSKQSEDGFEPIYVLDSQVTVFKMLNYLHEFQANYKKLLSLNPDYLYKTVFPTVEWMENVLAMLSKSSYKGGKEMFKQMQQSGVSVSVFHSI